MKWKMFFCSIWKLPTIASVLLLVVSLSGCKLDKITISGVIENSNKSYCVLMQIFPEDVVVVDTIAILSGKFSYRIKSDDIGVYLLKISDDSFLSFIASPADNLIFSGNANNFTQTCSVKGNEESELLMESRHKLNQLYEDIKPLSQEFIKHAYSDDFDSIKTVIDSSYNILFENHKEYLTNFIISNPDKLASLMAFYQALGQNTFFSIEEDRDLLEMIYAALSKKYPESLYVIHLKEKLEE